MIFIPSSHRMPRNKLCWNEKDPAFVVLWSGRDQRKTSYKGGRFSASWWLPWLQETVVKMVRVGFLMCWWSRSKCVCFHLPGDDFLCCIPPLPGSNLLIEPAPAVRVSSSRVFRQSPLAHPHAVPGWGLSCEPLLWLLSRLPSALEQQSMYSNCV